MHSPVTSSHLAVLGHEHAWQSGKPKYSGSHLATRKIIMGDYSITKGLRGSPTHLLLEVRRGTCLGGSSSRLPRENGQSRGAK